MGRRRILFNALGIAQSGGSRSYIKNVVEELSRDDRGFHFSVLCFPDQLHGIDTGEIEPVTLELPGHVPGTSGAIWRVLLEETWLPYRSRDYDLLYCQGDLAPFHGRTPSVVLLRNLNIYDRRWYPGPRTWLLSRLVLLGCRHARRILFPSQAAADIVTQNLPIPRDRITVVPYGISLDAFEKGEAAQVARPYLFLAAAPERHKNIEVLIDCVPYLEDPALEVWIAGVSHLDAEHQALLERRAADLGIAGRVRFLGAVPYSQVLSYYRGALALVFPSLLESFGHPILEAMAAGTPIIASDIPTFRENAGDAALFFPPHDAKALARAVEQLRRNGEATRHRVELGHAHASEFSWKRNVDHLCRVLDEVLTSG